MDTQKKNKPIASRLAFLVPYHFVPPINGGQKAAYGFAEFLGRQRKLICISSYNNTAENLPFPLFRLFRDKPWKYIHPLVARRIGQVIRQEKVNTLILHQPFMGLLALPLKWLLRLQLVIFVQNIEYQRFRSLGKWWWPGIYLLEWLIYRAATYLLFISPDDQLSAKKAFGLIPQRCRVVSYGTHLEHPPDDREKARQAVCQRHGIKETDYLMIFFGPQSYQPNLEAVDRIAGRINPLLKEQASSFSYRILICGGGLPATYNRLKAYRDQGIDYLGFVEDIDEYILAADLMLNPITSGGGVKTKVIESLALGTPVLSTTSGAKGVEIAVCGEALKIVPDEDDKAFCHQIIQLQKTGRPKVPSTFFQTYHWSAAIEPVLDIL